MNKKHHLVVSILKNRKVRGLLCVAAFSLVLYIARDQIKASKVNPTEGCVDPHSNSDGGDCDALGGRRRPKWACFSDMRSSIKPFLKFYAQRPVSANEGGMRIDHSFALWFMLLRLRPKTVIESGAWNGQSTWIIRNTLPNVRIISMDPREPLKRLADVEYYVKDNFVDFGEMDWGKLGVDPLTTLVFVDDHQMSTRRMFKDNKHGFRHFIIDDNYPITKSKFYSLKGVCNRKFKAKWRGFVTDNFGSKEIKMTWKEHVRNGDALRKKLRYYYEFPPLAAKEFVKHRYADTAALSTAIVNDRQEFDNLFCDIDAEEFTQYLHMAYAEIKV